MTVFAEYTVAADDFVLGRAAVPSVGVELERLLVDGDRTVSYFWALGATDCFEQSLGGDSAIEEFRTLDDVGDRQFYRGVCDPSEEPLIDAVCQFDAAVLCADGDDERWQFCMEFDDGGSLSGFQNFCVDSADLDVELEHLYNPVERGPGVESDLTPRQRETLVTAFREGYFDIPRKITLVDLAEELQVSDQAVSERLRRGESKLIRNNLLED